jgi:hypothetical protein
VEISFPSDAKKVWLAAFGFVQVMAIRSMRLLIPIMLRELWTEAMGRGRPFFTAEIRAEKFALTPFP